jgi:hypothetical protein
LLVVQLKAGIALIVQSLLRGSGSVCAASILQRAADAGKQGTQDAQGTASSSAQNTA